MVQSGRFCKCSKVGLVGKPSHQSNLRKPEVWVSTSCAVDFQKFIINKPSIIYDTLKRLSSNEFVYIIRICDYFSKPYYTYFTLYTINHMPGFKVGLRSWVFFLLLKEDAEGFGKKNRVLYYKGKKQKLSLIVYYKMKVTPMCHNTRMSVILTFQTENIWMYL